jgi:hypothetical protein
VSLCDKTCKIAGFVCGGHPQQTLRQTLNCITRRGTSRHLRDKKREYLQDKIDEPATRSKNKIIRDLYRGIN